MPTVITCKQNHRKCILSLYFATIRRDLSLPVYIRVQFLKRFFKTSLLTNTEWIMPSMRFYERHWFGYLSKMFQICPQHDVIGDQQFLHRLLPFTLFQSLLDSLSTTAWHSEWEGVSIYQIKMHIQMHFNVQCILKSLPQKLYDPTLQCNFSIKTFYHNKITNSNLFISFFYYQLVLG
jgi:hypothetical protein